MQAQPAAVRSHPGNPFHKHVAAAGTRGHNRDMSSVAVIIPVYNREDYLREALDSVFAQTRPADEVIVVDDGSTDASADVAASYPGVTLIRQVNRGVSEARNNAVRAATSEWIAFLDSDDVWTKDKLELQMEALAAAPGYDACTCNTMSLEAGAGIDDEGPPPSTLTTTEDIAAGLRGRVRLPPGSIVVRRQLVLDVGIFDDTARPCEDWDLWLRLAAAGCKFLVCPQRLLLIRAHESNLSNQSYRMMKAELLAWDRHIGPRYPPRVRRLARRAAHSHFLGRVALVEREQGRPHLGVMARSLLLSPIGDWHRHKVFLHMLLSRAGLVRTPSHSNADLRSS